MIDIGHTVNGLRCDEYYDSEHHYDYPAFWMACSRGHRTFASVKQIEAGNVVCALCKEEDARKLELEQPIVVVKEVGDPMRLKMA